MQSSDRVGVRVTSVSNVFPLTKTPSPSPLNLSFFDNYWIWLSPVQRLFLYSTNTPFNSLIPNLKHSLSLSLEKFYPLAGKLVYSPGSGELEIDCSVGDGIVFVEAEWNGSDADFRRLASADMHDVAAFQSLVPELDVSELPAPLMSVQVTSFSGGGVAVGISINHVAVDGRGLWDFVKSWAYTCRMGVGLVGPILSHDRTAIGGSLAMGVSKLYLQALAPSLPKLTKRVRADPNLSNLMQRTFVINSKNIRSLKERSTACNNHNSIPISTFVVLGAHIWICNMRAKGLNDDEKTYFSFLMDCRSHLDPPVDEGYFGNCVRPCIVISNGLDLLGKNGIMHATMVIRKAIHEASEEPLRNCEDWAKQLYEIPLSRTVNVVGSLRFTVYDVTDFGWGRPNRVELVSMDYDGITVLTGARDEGGVQVSVTLSPTSMDKFAKLFLADLDG